MNILNLYAGLGGNRQSWTDCIVTAVEINPKIAQIYHDFYPQDTVVVADAHQYLLDHYHEFEFIWASPPCPTHSRMRRFAVARGQTRPVYPEMSLYQEILFLQHYATCFWIVENVIPYYKPLLSPTIQLGRHLFWANFYIWKRSFPLLQPIKGRTGLNVQEREKFVGISLASYTGIDKNKSLKNYIDPAIGAWILQCCRNQQQAQQKLF